MKFVRKVSLILIFILIASFLLTSCSFKNKGEAENEVGEPLETVERRFEIFACTKVKVCEVLEGTYVMSEKFPCVFAKCEVVDGYNSGVPVGTEIFCPFILYGADAEEMRGILASADKIVVSFLDVYAEKFKMGQSTYNSSDWMKYEIFKDKYIVSYPIDFTECQLFVINDGRLDYSGLDSLYLGCNRGDTGTWRTDHLVGFSDYFVDDMTEEELDVSIKRLYDNIDKEYLSKKD